MSQRVRSLLGAAVGKAGWRLSAAYLVLFTLFGLSVVYRFRQTADDLDELLHGEVLANRPFDVALPGFLISGTTPESLVAGLRTGDVIVGVEGRPVRGLADVFAPLRNARAGDRLEIRVESPTRTAPTTLSITLQPLRRGPPRLSEWLTFAVVYLALPYLCLGLGFWVAAVRIEDGRAWLVLLLMLSLAEFGGLRWRTLLGRDDWFQALSAFYQPVLANLWPTAMMLFGIYFPDRLTLDRRYPWAKWLVIVPVLVRGVGSNIVVTLLTLRHASSAAVLDKQLHWMSTPYLVLSLIEILTFFAAISYKTATATSPDERRRLLLIDTGAVVGCTPLIVVFWLALSGLVTMPDWIVAPLLACLFVFPLTMAYVIVVTRAMDVRVFVRTGVQYLLARGTVRAAQALLSTLIVVAVVSLSSATEPGKRGLLISTALGVVLLLRGFADRWRLWVDRRFFREAYDAERVLSDLANNIRTVLDTSTLLDMVAENLSKTLHIPRIAILLNEHNALRPAHALGYSPVPSVPIPEGWTDRSEQALRESLGSELILPLTANQNLIGVLSLGPKQSEEPYSGSDVRLLNAVATQTGLALVNSRLTAEIAAETAKREKARRELEIAREVQERLFPQEYPPVRGLDYAGGCRPALGVGGDYYDFIHQSTAGQKTAGPGGGTTELGVAIGDVSGKGIPAALLMATLRAFVRAQTIRDHTTREGADHPRADLASMMANLNTLVFESSTPNKYATFFYGHYD
ncbi:MAG TPA: SpoIIE family protein phosphatase, partial [Vicinamibacterales bacterium]|nr:SpoIIE family protein phosphatase [Vicinamibacterales bacterium]